MNEIKKIPTEDKLKILSFLSYLKKNNTEIKWNDNLEVIYLGKKIKNSHIISLIKHALKKESKSKPVGMKLFYKILSKIDFPKSLVKNKKGILIIKKNQNKNNKMWRPPGKLS